MSPFLRIVSILTLAPYQVDKEKKVQEENVEGKSSTSQKPPGGMNVFQVIVNKMMAVLEKGSIVGQVFLFIMMMLTVADVVGRYFFNRPVQGTNELTGLFLVCVAAAALAYSQIKKGHIRVDLISSRLSPKGQNILDVIAYLFCLFGSALITWQTFVRAADYIISKRATETLVIPFFPFMLLLGFGFFFLALVSLVDLIKSLAKVVAK